MQAWTKILSRRMFVPSKSSGLFSKHQQSFRMFGFTQSPHDYCLFIRAKTFFCLLVDVDDLLIMGPQLSHIAVVKKSLHTAFTIKDFGPVKYYLRLEIAHSSEGIFISQYKYIEYLIKNAGLKLSKSTTTPLSLGCKLIQSQVNLSPNPKLYRRVVGSLLYLDFTRLDITQAGESLSQFMNSHTIVNKQVALHILKYLKGSSTLGLFHPANQEFKLSNFSDVDQATCTDSRKSVTGFCIFLVTHLMENQKTNYCVS